MNLKSRPGIFVGVALTSALALSACSDSVDTSDLEPLVRVDSNSAGKEEDEAEGLFDDFEEDDDEIDTEVEPEAETDEPSAPSGDYTNPAWALPVAAEGDLLKSFEAGNFQIDVYQVEIGEAAEDSIWVHEETEEPVLAKGDPVVVLNFVLTNTGSEEIRLSNLFLGTRMNYASSETFLGAMEDLNRGWLEELGVNADAYDEYNFDGVFPIAPGESISEATIYEYRPEPAEITFSVTTVDEDGELDFDSEFNFEVEETIDLK